MMIAGHVFIAVSLDGFIAREDGDLDWLTKYSTGEEDHGYGEFIDTVDGLIMGRGTYQKVLTFGDWPYAKPVVVLSRSLSQSDIPEELRGKVRITNAFPREIMDTLNEEGWRRVYIDGGKVIQAFLREGLIWKMIIARVPILLGSGIPLFGTLDDDVDLNHLETTTYSSGLVQSTYEIVQNAE